MKRIEAMSCVLVLGLWSAIALAQAPAATDRPGDHEALRGMLKSATEALNTRNFDLIAPSLDSGFTAVSVDNQKLVGLDAFKQYWNGLFDGPDAKVTRIEVKPVPDAPAQFLDDNVGVIHGTSQDVYTFSDGDVRTMKTRWSAVVRKGADGWKLVNVHFSAGILDNPVVDAVKAGATKWIIGAGGAGLLLGLLLMGLMRRR